jgi:hypothetical protein
MSETFEYAIRKDVRNNPIVREVDEARHRDLWKSVGIVGLFVVVAGFAGLQRMELVRHGFQVEELQRRLAEEQEVARRLRVRIEELSAPGRIEHEATTKLKMIAPTIDEAGVIERAVPTAPPPGAVVARR